MNAGGGGPPTPLLGHLQVREVRANLAERLLSVGCETRVFKFAFASRETCELWATNLVQASRCSRPHPPPPPSPHCHLPPPSSPPSPLD